MCVRVCVRVPHAPQCPRPDKLLHVMALLRLGLCRKKVLLFVNTVDEGVRLRLFLEAFGVRPALLNAELPLNSRSHILSSFNRGLFDFLIATDDVYAPSHDRGDGAAAGAAAAGGKKAGARLGKDGSGKRGAKGGDGARKDAEFGVTRGIDFKGVRTVINYDPPSSLQGYVHRVGRTGAGGRVWGGLRSADGKGRGGVHSRAGGVCVVRRDGYRQVVKRQ